MTGTADNIIYFYEDGNELTNGVYKIDFTQTSSLVSQNSRYVYDADTGKGEIVEDVVLGTATGMASELGLEAGDIVSSFVIGRSGEEIEYSVNRTFDISDILFALRPGDTLTVKYERSGVSNKTGNSVTLELADFSSVA